MKRNTIRQLGCVILALLLSFLCGCGLIGQEKQTKELAQAEMDALLVQFMTCVENQDVKGACDLAYGREQMRQVFPSIVTYWPAQSTDPYEASGLNIEETVSEDQQLFTLTRAVYLVTTNGADYQIILTKRSDSEKEGIATLNATRIQELVNSGVIPEAKGFPIEEKNVLQWCFTAFWILSCLLCLYTIIILLRRKPRLYGLWIWAALVFVGVFVYKTPGGMQFGPHLGLLNSSEWIRYQNGVNYFQLCLPFGAMIYWIWRIQRHRKHRKSRRSSKNTSRPSLFRPSEESTASSLSQSDDQTTSGSSSSSRHSSGHSSRHSSGGFLSRSHHHSSGSSSSRSHHHSSGSSSSRSHHHSSGSSSSHSSHHSSGGTSSRSSHHSSHHSSRHSSHHSSHHRHSSSTTETDEQTYSTPKTEEQT